MNLDDKPKVRIWIYIATSVAFLSIPFLISGCGFFSLFALVPLFLLNEFCEKRSIKRAWIYYYLLFFFWNLITTYWVYNATIPGAIAAVVLNSLQMSIVFALFRLFKNQLAKRGKGDRYSALPYIFFAATWIAWEHFYFDTQVSWPWLVLGNSFARSIRWIQWYEFTGTLGGSLWILSSNIILYKIISRKRYVYGFVSLIVLPIALSLILFATYEEKYNPREFVVIQPNIDPYKDKFVSMTREDQDNILLTLAGKEVTDTTDYIVAPETFTSYIDEGDIYASSTVRRLNAFIGEHSSANFIFGAISIKVYPWGVTPNSSEFEKPTITSRKGNGYWYDAYNSSFIMDSTGKWDVYHKSKLVVLAEFVPFPNILKHFEKLSIELGGTISSYSTQPEISVFTANDGVKIGTAICYESVYGDYYRGYILKGAQVMTIITNDGWWGNTPGYRQHLSYASLRAIETRRSIARSANTGISGFVNQKGEIFLKSEWWAPESIRSNLNLNDKITFFVKYGDIIGRVSTLLFLLLSLYCCALILDKVVKNVSQNKR